MNYECDRVYALEDIDDADSERIPSGTQGLIIDPGGPGRRPVVVFLTHGGVGRRHEVTVTVEPHQIAPA